MTRVKIFRNKNILLKGGGSTTKYNSVCAFYCRQGKHNCKSKWSKTKICNSKNCPYEEKNIKKEKLE